MMTFAEKIKARISSDLTPEQQSLVNTTTRTVVVAGPGSGKTKTVAYRLGKWIAEWKPGSKGAAVLSFTNNAIEEIRFYLDKLGISLPLPNAYFLGTIDSFLTQNVVRPYGYLAMGCDGGVQVVPNERKAILDSFLQKNTKSIPLGKGVSPRAVYLAEIDYLPNGDLDFGRLFQGTPPWVKQDVIKKSICEAKRNYAKSGLATHSDIVYWSYKLLTEKTFPWITQSLQEKYPNLILDEAQDTSFFHELILNALWLGLDSSQIVIIGDPDQAIFEWNKAYPKFLIEMLSPKPDAWSVKTFNDNWRSSQPICNATHPFRNIKIFNKPANAVGPDAGLLFKPILLTFPSEQYNKLPQALKTLWKQRVKMDAENNKSLAVVAWRNDLVARIKGQSISEVPLTLIGKQLAEIVLNYNYDKKSEAYDMFVSVLCHLIWERPDLGLNNELLPWPFTYEWWCTWTSALLIKIGNIPDQITVKEFVGQTREIIEGAFAEFDWIENKKLGYKIRSTGDAVAQNLLMNYFDADADLKSVLVTTVHKVKGSSLEGVMLTGYYDATTRQCDVQEWMMPSDPTTGLSEEPKRIAYVAMTRPRKLLVVAIPKECGAKLINHDIWKQGQFEYVDIASLPDIKN